MPIKNESYFIGFYCFIVDTSSCKRHQSATTVIDRQLHDEQSIFIVWYVIRLNIPEVTYWRTLCYRSKRERPCIICDSCPSTIEKATHAVMTRLKQFMGRHAHKSLPCLCRKQGLCIHNLPPLSIVNSLPHKVLDEYFFQYTIVHYYEMMCLL